MISKVMLDRRTGTALHEQLIDQLRDLILSGDLPPGTRLPPSRKAARELGVSRNVVVLAYEQLQMEGYLEARVGSGTRVQERLPGHLLRPRPSHPGNGTSPPPDPPRFSTPGTRLARARPIPLRHGQGPAPFLPGVVAPEHFPHRLWSRLAGRLWRTRTRELVGYGRPEGDPILRDAIAAHVRRFRAVRCTAEQVLITSGSQQALDLVARMMIDPGDPVLVEDPGYRGARVAFEAAGAQLHPVPVDEDGGRFGETEPVPQEARLVYTAPSHQYPMGVTLTLSRRLRLLEWARETGAWIVEDDYDSEFRYGSRPLPALQGLDPEGRVIYLGTLSKVLAPGLRLGFLILPEPLVEPFRSARTVTDTHSPSILQAILGEFIREGHLERHIAKLRGIYAERREALTEALRGQVGDLGEVVSDEAGLHLTALLPPGVDDRKVSRLAAGEGVEAPALSDYAIRELSRGGLVLGFGAAPVEETPGAVRRLAAAIREARGISA